LTKGAIFTGFLKQKRRNFLKALRIPVGVGQSFFTGMTTDTMKFGSISAPFERHLILGVDPGLTGALAAIDRKTGLVAYIDRLPTLKTPSKSRKQGFLSHIDLSTLTHELKFIAPKILFAAVEDPGAMPNQGLGSTFRFGAVCGQIQGVLAGLDIPFVLIKPSVWKGALGLSQDKGQSLKLAGSLAKTEFKKKDHDVAEAILIAHFAERFINSK